jgi:hypothetical protein
VDDVVTPEFNESPDTPVGHDDGVLEGGPVVILNTWKIDEADFPEFTSLMNEVRLIRLSTGAHRWRLFRNTSDPTRLTELMVVRSWEEHLAQHRRIDDAAAGLIRRARRFDIEDGPRTRHLIAVDVERAPDFEDLVATHEKLHQTDGSIPQQDQGV